MAGFPRSHITFRACTRKKNPDGTQTTRQVPIHDQLRDRLKVYCPPKNVWLFPAPGNSTRSMGLKVADLALRRSLFLAGMESKGFCTHSTRRTFITTLHAAGVDIYTIQKITGHSDLKALSAYVEISSDRVSNAISLL